MVDDSDSSDDGKEDNVNNVNNVRKESIVNPNIMLVEVTLLDGSQLKVDMDSKASGEDLLAKVNLLKPP